MSRSYKKFPFYRYSLWGNHNKSMKKGKRVNNRKIRRKLKNVNIDVSTKGKYYRSFGFDSWDLWEYRSIETKQDAIDRWERRQREKESGKYPWRHYSDETLEEAINDWKNWYIRK